MSKQSVYILGDLHFSASQPWRLEVGEKFLRWFDSEFKPDPNSIFICMGDVSDEALNPGEVILQLERFKSLMVSKFSHSYILVGNHDLKLYKDRPHLSFEFMATDRLTILREPAEVLKIAGLDVLSLPHYNYRNDMPSMNVFYSNLPSEILDRQYDLVLGHFADGSSDQIFAHHIDLTPIKTHLVCLGDIHTRFNDHYTGSAYACKVIEHDTKLPRAIWKVTKDDLGVKKEELPLPVFCGFYYVEYPTPLPDTEALVNVWTVSGIDTKDLAEKAYPGAYIRSVSTAKKLKTTDTVVSAEDFHSENISEVFTEFLKTMKTPISRTAVSLIRELIAPPVVVPPAVH